MKRFHTFCRTFPGVDVSWTAHQESLLSYFQAIGQGTKIDKVEEAPEEADEDGQRKQRWSFKEMRKNNTSNLKLAYLIYNDRSVA